MGVLLSIFGMGALVSDQNRQFFILFQAARVRFLTGTNVNTSFIQVPTPDSGMVPMPNYKVLTRALIGSWVLWLSVFDHNAFFCPCSSIRFSAQALSVNTASVVSPQKLDPSNM